MNVSEYFNKQPKPYLVIIGLILVVMIGIIDYLTGAEISSAVFYLLPISLASWFISKRGGILVSIFSTVTWIAADLMARKSFLHPLVHFWNTLMSLSFFLIVSYILSALKTSLEREKELARTDFLTNFINRRYFVEIANREIRRSRRFKRHFTVSYIDIDDFKIINDRFGHNEGDALLSSFAADIKKNIRETDIPVRLGGDEFAILMPETDHAAALVVLPKLKERLSETMKKKRWPVTLSIGVMTFMTPPASIDDMISRVDNLMYSVKKSGKNEIRYDVFEDIKMAERR